MTEQQQAAMRQALEFVEANHSGGPDAFELITALRQALANEALDRMAENAKELGLNYDPAGGTQVSKVWWDGDRLMAKPIPLSEVYKEPEQQSADEPVAYMGTDIEGNPNKFRLNPFAGGIPLYKQPAKPVKVWDAEGYDALMQELELWKAKAQKPAAWVGLTDEEVAKISRKHKWHSDNLKVLMPVFRSLEAKLREKNDK